MEENFVKINGELVDLTPNKVYRVCDTRKEYVKIYRPKKSNIWGNVIQNEEYINSDILCAYAFIIEYKNGMKDSIGDFVFVGSISNDRIKEIDKYREKVIEILGWEVNPDVLDLDKELKTK